MKLGVRLFARAKEAVGRDRVEVDVPEQATVADLRAALAGQFPALAPLAPHLLIAINADYAADTTILDPNAEIACFPPVSGG
jgi:sulfur-carrier protein